MIIELAFIHNKLVISHPTLYPIKGQGKAYGRFETCLKHAERAENLDAFPEELLRVVYPQLLRIVLQRKLIN